MGMSSVPLSELYAGAAQFLEDNGAELHLNTNVESAEWDEEVSQWTVNTRAGTLVSDFLVIALPFEAMQKLLPHMPPAPHAEDLARKVDRFEHWPICSVHLWFDREITDLHHAVLLDREIHWMYNKSLLQPWRKQRQLSRTGQSALARIRGPRTRAGHRAGARRTRRILSCESRQRSSKRPR